MEKPRKNPKAEAKRLNSLIYTKNDAGDKIQNNYLITEVYLTNVEELQEVFNLILESGVDIILALFTETKTGIIILTYIPKKVMTFTAEDFFNAIVSPMRLVGVSIYQPIRVNAEIVVQEIKFEKTEYYPEKVLSQGISNAFQILKSLGIHKEDEEEKEYDFDDI